MPTSTFYFKTETKNFIIENFSKESKILDIGAGIGTYSDLLKNEYKYIDAVEVFFPYISQYKLDEKYRNVFYGNIISLPIQFSEYDLVILGDVLEHISENDAKILLEKISVTNSIVAVPFQSPQGSHFGNDFETHLQPDLTLINFFDRFPNYYPLCLRFDYGVFTNMRTKKLYTESEEKEIPTEYINFINKNFNHIEIMGYETQESKLEISKINSDVTIVTALWNLGRDSISNSFKRNYEDYLEKFSLLLKTDVPMYIFVDKSDEEFIWSIRSKENTILNLMTLDELQTWFEFTNLTDEIRQKETWINQASWLSESPQCTLKGYNPVVMSKMFMLNNVTIWNPFSSKYFFWIDAGITSTVNYGYFTHDKVFDKLPHFIEKNKNFTFISFPYEGGNEIHGFDREAMAKYCNTDYVKFVCRGGFFGGKKETINEINGLYYSYLKSTLDAGFMGTEESIFTILMYNHSNIITQFSVEPNGLIWPFFESIKDGDYDKFIINKKSTDLDITKVGLYVITFNSPSQFRTLIKSFLEYDKEYLTKTKKFLLDNSSDESTFEEYSQLCEEFNFEHIKKDNLGICGGRQFIAEHFNDTDLDYYLFFEDDMFFFPNEGVCRNGFNRYVQNLYSISLEIMKKENFDFIKLNYSEFFGDNGTQWSWYNVPQVVREEFWPGNPRLPVQGLDPNAPRAVYKNIISHRGVPYTNGEVYYSNWPQIVSRSGNKKMFLDTTWAHPYEQTWMSHMFQLTKKGELNGGLLLMTPTEHNRFEHYDGKLRKES